MKHQALFSTKDKSKKKSVVCCIFAWLFKGQDPETRNIIESLPYWGLEKWSSFEYFLPGAVSLQA